MNANERGEASGVFGWVPGLLRALGVKSEPEPEIEYPPLRDKPGPSGLPPAPPRVRRGPF